MRIVGVSSSPSTVARQTANESHDGTPPEAQNRDLITIEPAQRDERSPRWTHHPSAPFVAQLIATRMQAPQTRERRRAEPEEASAVYRSMTKPVPCNRAFGARV